MKIKELKLTDDQVAFVKVFTPAMNEDDEVKDLLSYAEEIIKNMKASASESNDLQELKQIYEQLKIACDLYFKEISQQLQDHQAYIDDLKEAITAL